MNQWFEDYELVYRPISFKKAAKSLVIRVCRVQLNPSCDELLY
jgi:hypothetical protein